MNSERLLRSETRTSLHGGGATGGTSSREDFGHCVAAALSGLDGRPVSIAVSPCAMSPAVVDCLPRDPALWANVALFLTDTRMTCVGSSPACLREAVAGLPLRQGQLHFNVADQPDPMRAAMSYEQELRNWFRLDAGRLPKFDLMIVRQSTGGIVAGLQAGGAAMDEVSRLAVATRSGGAGFVTLTPPVLQAARQLIVLDASGASPDAPALAQLRRLIGGASARFTLEEPA